MEPMTTDAVETVVDLRTSTVREVNTLLHRAPEGTRVRVEHPRGAHNIAVGIDRDVDVTVAGHAGYYAAGMHKAGTVRFTGSVGNGVAENMMSGTVHVHGDASQSAGATAHGGLLLIDGSTGARCGIAMKGVDIVVGGDIGHMSAFMAQAGRLVVCGDAGDSLGDSIYEARIYVRGTVASLGADCVEKPMRAEHEQELAGLLARAGRSETVDGFRRYGSARTLYHFHSENSSAY